MLWTVGPAPSRVRFLRYKTQEVVVAAASLVCLQIVDSLRQEWMKVSLRLIRTLLDLDQKFCELEASLEMALLDLTIDHLGRGSGLLNSTQGLDLV